MTINFALGTEIKFRPLGTVIYCSKGCMPLLHLQMINSGMKCTIKESGNIDNLQVIVYLNLEKKQLSDNEFSLLEQIKKTIETAYPI